MSPDDVPGAAQVSLAKLGDPQAMQQLTRELQQRVGKAGWWAPRKLSRVGNDAATALLLNYLASHEQDFSRVTMHGDYGEDPFVEIFLSLSLVEFLQDPPAPFSDNSVVISRWLTWWKGHKSSPITYTIHDAGFSAPRLRCLARKVAWGFLDAILDLAAVRDKQVLALLHDLAEVGNKTDPTSPFDTVRGHAQTALAILGEEDQFHAIVHELDTLAFKDAVAKLQVIGGNRSVDALINGFDSPNFLADRPDYTADKEHIGGIIFDHDEAIASALAKMLVYPVDTLGEPGTKRKWQEWWAENKNTAVFVAPSKSYE